MSISEDFQQSSSAGWSDQEGLVLQGCGGDPQEWLDGINQILTEEGILKKGARFEEAYTFRA